MTFDPQSYASRLVPDALAIFLFHGVVEESPYKLRNRNRKHLEADYFAAAIRALRAVGQPVSLDEVLEAARAGEPLPPRSFAVTFDDGFLNNLTIAAPILVDFGVPATFYVTTAFIETNAMSWVDRIELAMERRATGTLTLPWGERRYDDEASALLVLQDIRTQVKSSPALNPCAVADLVQEQLGCPGTLAGDEPIDRKMDWTHVRRLSGSSGMSIGGHSHTHPILSFLDGAALDNEITTSLALLAEKAGVGPRHYSYPEGLAHCYSERVIERLKAAGVECCPTAIDGINPPRSDPFHLKRIMVV